MVVIRKFVKTPRRVFCATLTAGSAGYGSYKITDRPFSLQYSRDDQSTFIGRFTTALRMMDARTLFTTDEKLEKYQNALTQFKENNELPAGWSDRDMWKARSTVDAIIHPVTQERMFWPGRMSAFVPLCIPICFGVLTAHTPAAIIFWQWVNQSYNTMNNYVNRSSASVEFSNIAKSYTLAITSSIGIGIAASRMVKRSPRLLALGPFVPCLAVMAGSTSNIAFTRMDELRNGTAICNSKGDVIGVSKEAGRLAVFNTVLSRGLFLPTPIFLLPPLVMKMVSAVGQRRMFIELAVMSASLTIGLPIALALMPQWLRIPVASLEPEFRNLRDENGNVIEEVLVNKGL